MTYFCNKAVVAKNKWNILDKKTITDSKSARGKNFRWFICVYCTGEEVFRTYISFVQQIKVAENSSFAQNTQRKRFLRRLREQANIIASHRFRPLRGIASAMAKHSG